MIERAFGKSPWTVGVEEELLLVDERTLEPVAAAPRVLALGVDAVKQELFSCVVETTTGICTSAGEAAERLRAARRALAAAVAGDGIALMATGSHPFAIAEDQPVTDDADYLDFLASAGPAARRQLVSGLHVHVGMPDADTCVRAHEAVLPWLPLVLALSANSPWFRGERTGLMSKRAEVLATLPRGGVPPPVASYAEWEATMERWLEAGVLKRPTATWWDIRVHPALGTLELRMPDQPTSPSVAAAFVALLHALALHAARGGLRAGSRADFQTNRFFASRFGTGAKLLHPEADRLAGVPELFGELRERLADVIAEQGSADLVDVLDPTRCEAEQQLVAGPREAAADLVRRTLESRR